MTITLTLAEATATYKAVEQQLAQLRQQAQADGYYEMRIAQMEQIQQKIEDAILAD